MAKKRIGIIGGGIIGSSIAYHLSLYPDAQVTVLDKSSVGSGETAKSAGTVCLLDDSLPHEFWSIRLYGLNQLMAMERESPGCTGFQRSGTLVMAPDKRFESYLLQAVDLAVASGFQAEYWSGRDRITKIIPDLALDDVLGAAYTPDDGYFDPTAISNAYARKAHSHGVEVRTGTKVETIRTHGGRVTGVSTAKGDLELDVVVNAAGPWARFVGRMVGLELPVWHTKAEVFILEPEKPLGYPVPILKYPRFYARPETGNIFICKSHVGLDLSNTKDAGVFNPDDLPMRGGTEAYFWDFLSDQLMQYYPRLLESSVASDWVGYRGVTPDFLPILGDTPVDGFLVAAGPSGNGVIEAPTIGRDMAQYIMTGEKRWSIERLPLSRFDRPGDASAG